MKILKFLLQQIFHLLLILVGIVLVIWLLWNLICQIDFNIFGKKTPPSAVLPLVPEKQQKKLDSKSGDVLNTAETIKSAEADAFNKSSAGVSRSPAQFDVPETSGKESHIVLVTAEECKINGSTVRNPGELLDFLNNADKKTRVYFYPGYPADIYELIKSIDNKHVSTVIVPQ